MPCEMSDVIKLLRRACALYETRAHTGYESIQVACDEWETLHPKPQPAKAEKRYGPGARFRDDMFGHYILARVGNDLCAVSLSDGTCWKDGPASIEGNRWTVEQLKAAFPGHSMIPVED